MPIELNQEYTLRVQVRGPLVNASLNGEPLIAWESPLARRDGALQVITFDALAVIHEVTISALIPRFHSEPNSSPANPPLTLEMAEKAVADAQGEQTIAEAALTVAQAELESVERRTRPSGRNGTRRNRLGRKKRCCGRAERFATVAKARQASLSPNRPCACRGRQKGARRRRSRRPATLRKRPSRWPKPESSPPILREIQRREVDADTILQLRQGRPGGQVPSAEQRSPTALANWITDRRNPLTARVAVNHIGLVTWVSRWCRRCLISVAKGLRRRIPNCSIGWRAN